MKKSRLLEIIREEISTALTETEQGELELPKGTNTTTAKSYTDKGFDVKFVDPATGKMVQKEEKYKKLAEKYQLDEETINEMASIKQTIDGLKALGDERNEIVTKVAQDTLNQFKKNPAIASGGRLTRELEPNEYPNKKDRKISYSTEFLKNYKAETGKDFNELTYEIEYRWEKEKPGEKLPFKSPGLAANTTDKDAANQILGKIPSPKGPKPKAEKAPKEKAEKAPKAKVATRTAGDDGFDNVSYSGEGGEDKEAIQSMGSDSTAKDLGKKSSAADNFAKLFNVKTTEEAKEKMKELAKRANSGDQKAKAFFDNNSKIIQAYRNAQKVNA
jgi:hypothetical protein